MTEVTWKVPDLRAEGSGGRSMWKSEEGKIREGSGGGNRDSAGGSQEEDQIPDRATHLNPG